MKTKKDISQKPTFNFKEKKRNNSISGNEEILKSSKSIYDDIEKSELKLKDKKKLLNRVKSATIKECVYSNYNIPENWKNKVGYENKILKLFSKDEKFLFYVGNKNNEFEETKSTIYKKSNSFINKSFYTEEDKNSINNSELIMNKVNNKKKILLPLETENDKIKGIYINTKNKFHNEKKGKNYYSDKEVLSILDDYNNAFPLKEKKEENKKLSKTFSDNFENIKKMKKNERQEAFRQNIYNKMIPLNLKIQSVKNKNNKINKKQENKFGLYLNLNTEEFNKKIEIKNPIVKKYLESINFYGPYYSYCPPCKNRNMEFYKKMEQEKTIKLIQFIKKARGKSAIINNNFFNEKNQQKKIFNQNYLNKNFDNTFNSNSDSFK